MKDPNPEYNPNSTLCSLPAMSKSRSHRKRHVPPGPVGIWYRTQQQQLLSKNQESAKATNPEQRSAKGHSGERDSMHSDKPNNDKRSGDNSFSPVWSNVQDDLKLNTPYLSSWNGDPKQKYEELRPHLPPDFILLREILRGDYDFAIPPGFHLLLLVNAIESHNLHSICTVELHDETGLSVRAWVEPRYVQEQMRKQQEASAIRTGVVWMLKEVGMMVQMNEDDEKLERILLIGGKHITKVWTPEDAKDIDFLQHMERKKAMSQHIFEAHNEINGVQACVHEEDSDQEKNRLGSQATDGDGVGSTSTQNCFSHPRKEGEEELIRTAKNSHPLIATENSKAKSTAKTSPQDGSLQQITQYALVETATNRPSSQFLEKRATVMQSFSDHVFDTSPTDTRKGNNKRHNKGNHTQQQNASINQESSAAKKRRRQSKRSSESPKQPKAAPRICGSSASSLWDNVKVDDALDLFEDDDNRANNFPSPRIIQATTIMLPSEDLRDGTEEYIPHNTPMRTQKSKATPLDIGFRGFCSSLSQDQQSGEPSSSLFEASNLTGLDLSAFDDE